MIATTLAYNFAGISGYVFRDVAPGRHRIQVTAKLLSDQSIKQVVKLGPFRLVPPPPTQPPPPSPPHVTANGRLVNICDLQINFSANVSATFQCRINGGSWEACKFSMCILPIKLYTLI